MNIQVTDSPGLLSTIDVALPAFKFAGVIVTAFVPPVDVFKIVLICPFAPSAKVTGAAAEVALTSVTGSVNVTAVDVEPSPVIACDVEFKLH